MIKQFLVLSKNFNKLVYPISFVNILRTSTVTFQVRMNGHKTKI